MKVFVKLIHYVITIVLIFMIFVLVSVTFDFMTGKNQEASGAWVLSLIFTAVFIGILVYERKLMKKITARFDNTVKEKSPYSYAFDPDKAEPDIKADNDSKIIIAKKTEETLKEKINIKDPYIQEKAISDEATVDTVPIYETESKFDQIEDSGDGVHNSVEAKADILEEASNIAGESVKKEDNVPKVLKGIKGELSVNEKCVRVRNSVIPLLNIDEIVYKCGTTFTYGFVTFCTGSGVGEKVTKWTEADKNGNSIVFKADQNEILKEILDLIEEYVDYRITISDATYLSRPAPKGTQISFSDTYSEANAMEAKKAREELRLLKEQRKQAEKVAKCPRCGSTSLSANKKGFGIGKAVVGAYVAGPIGLVAGNINAKKVWVTCLKCGKRFKL